MKSILSKVNPGFIDYVLELYPDRDMNGLYSACVQTSYKTTGRMACGFDAKDMVAYLKQYHSEKFNEKGKRINK